MEAINNRELNIRDMIMSVHFGTRECTCATEIIVAAFEWKEDAVHVPPSQWSKAVYLFSLYRKMRTMIRII